ncbi:hypothetical protein [Pseudoalteromonas ruthenica]|uniref:hypothetical protein n=1 Tax=Pseudoalteromonas ruthenica TaxID=151081 RepID=UPI001243EF49|nr:hypothetical protein [Pseudoalteromonas ruthenica]
MERDKLVALIKFMKEEHTKDFVEQGLLHMNTIKYFRELEDIDPCLRGDENEGLEASLRPEHITIELNGRVLRDLKDKVDIRPVHQDETKIYCMTLITIDDIKKSENSTIYLSEKFLNFGDKAAIIYGKDINLFFEQLKKEITRREDLFTIEDSLSKKVDYLERSEHHRNLGVFTKFIEYSWQYEYRIALKKENEPDYIQLRIGDLSQIVEVTDTASLIKHPIKIN